MKFFLSIKRIGALLVCTYFAALLAACGGDVDKTSPAANRAPVADFTAVTEGTTLYVDGSVSIDRDGDFLSYTWIFDNGITSNDVSALVSYSAPGQYQIRLTVSDGAEIDFIEKTIVVDQNLVPVEFDTNGPEDPQVTSGRDYYDIYCLVCHGEDGNSTTSPIDLTKEAYAHSSNASMLYNLEDYIVNFMPEDAAGGPSFCIGECAADITAYLNYVSDAQPTSTPTPTPIPTAQPRVEMRLVQIPNPADTNIPSGSASSLAVLQDGVTVNVNGVQYVGLEVIPYNYPSVYGVAFALTGAETVDPQIDITSGYFVNEGSGYFDRNAGALPAGDYTLTATIYITSDTFGETVQANFSVADDGGPNVAPVADLSRTSNTEGDAPLTVSFDGTASSDDESIISFTWEFDDGSANGTGSQVQHVYTSPGTYTATLTVLDNEGASDQDSISITVTEPFDAEGFYADNCLACHAADGSGNPLFEAPALDGSYTQMQLEAEIMVMPSESNSACDGDQACIEGLADYIFENFATEL